MCENNTFQMILVIELRFNESNRSQSQKLNKFSYKLADELGIYTILQLIQQGKSPRKCDRISDKYCDDVVKH